MSLRLKSIVFIVAGLIGLTFFYLWERRAMAASQVLDWVMSTDADPQKIRRIELSVDGSTRAFTLPAEIVSAIQSLRFCRREDRGFQTAESSFGTLRIETLRGSHDYRIKRAGDTAFIGVLRDFGSGWVVFDPALLKRLVGTGAVDPPGTNPGHDAEKVEQKGP